MSPDIQAAKDTVNMAMYISFGPVFIIYFCYSWKKVTISNSFWSFCIASVYV